MMWQAKLTKEKIGVVGMYVVHFDEKNPYLGKMNPPRGRNEGGEGEEEGKVFEKELGVRLGGFTAGQYFGEQTFVSAFRRSGGGVGEEDKGFCWGVVFVAEMENTEVVGLGEEEVLGVLGEVPMTHSSIFFSFFFVFFTFLFFSLFHLILFFLLS